jgi:hypothetical protein
MLRQAGEQQFQLMGRVLSCDKESSKQIAGSRVGWRKSCLSHRLTHNDLGVRPLNIPQHLSAMRPIGPVRQPHKQAGRTMELVRPVWCTSGC